MNTPSVDFLVGVVHVTYRVNNVVTNIKCMHPKRAVHLLVCAFHYQCIHIFHASFTSDASTYLMHQLKSGLAEIYGIELPENTDINFTGYVCTPTYLWG